MPSRGTLLDLVNRLEQAAGDRAVTSDRLWHAIRGALNPQKMVSNLAEAMRIAAPETESLLGENGFGDLVARLGHRDLQREAAQDSASSDVRPSTSSRCSPFPALFSVEFSPQFGEAIPLVSSVCETIQGDAFLRLYRDEVGRYFQEFMAGEAPKITSYLRERFPNGYPKYIVNSGIGANEQFNHLLAYIYNSTPGQRSVWLIINSPRHLRKLPSDATLDSTLFLEFSRSGKTEETVKLHEFTAREANRIVFANSGPLRDIGIRDNNLVMELPDEVSGRFGRNKTPILLAPMLAAGMDVNRLWRGIEESIAAYDLSSPASLPVQIAQFIYVHQEKNSVNHIYVGCNDDALQLSRDEFLQFWNEGVNKDGNDIMMSGYFGLLRDSHANIEGILANRGNKLGIFLLSDSVGAKPLPAMAHEDIDPINQAHAGLKFGDDELILAEANYRRFRELMPVIKITVHGVANIDHAAVLGQLWADVTFFYSKLKYIDPGSNPEVKHVRDRAAELLAEEAAHKRERSRG